MVRRKVASGLYAFSSDVVREALRLSVSIKGESYRHNKARERAEQRVRSHKTEA